jgi:2-polyprenyl-3-methyl-5-hydroxy-6-metoxy-1,4-benzoquinol methylase
VAGRRPRAAAPADTLGWITDRSDFDDPRGYPPARFEFDLVEKRVRLAGKHVLEVGCGNGRLTVELATRARRVTAIEPHRDLAARARARVRSLGLGKVTVNRRPAQTGIRGGPYDAVLFSWSLC